MQECKLQNDITYPHKITKKKLLVVDADSYSRSALTYMLGSLGYAAEGVGSGHEALALLKRTSFDLMLLDIYTPDIHGLDLMRLARKLQPELLMIILTGQATLESAIEAVKLGVVDYLLKPIDTDQLTNAVIRALQKQTKQLHWQHLLGVVNNTADTLRQIEKDSASRALY